jgi:hypothetical protein
VQFLYQQNEEGGPKIDFPVSGKARSSAARFSPVRISFPLPISLV